MLGGGHLIEGHRFTHPLVLEPVSHNTHADLNQIKYSYHLAECSA